MPATGPSSQSRIAFNFTELSTRKLLFGATLTCVLLWAVIAATVGI